MQTDPHSSRPQFRSDISEAALERAKLEERQRRMDAAVLEREHWRRNEPARAAADQHADRLISWLSHPAVLGGLILSPAILMFGAGGPAWLGYYLLHAGDIVTGSRLLPRAPWVVWTAWGAVFGGCLQYSLTAHPHGHRGWLSPVICAPLLLMALVTVISLVFGV